MHSTRSRRLVLTLASTTLLALSSGAFSFVDTHLDEIAVPLGEYAADRVAVIDLLPAPTKAEKRERTLLRKLVKKEAKFARSLKSDFTELIFGSKTAKKLKASAEPMRGALDESFARAELALGERAEFVNDHVLLIPAGKALTKIQKLITKYETARANANAAPTDDKRAKLLGKAQASITAALKRAEKAAQKAVNLNGQLRMPPIRLRSGDLVGTGGARVSIPIDADSPIAGASVLIPSGALASSIRITIEPGSPFVGDRDVPAGPTMRCLPAGTQFNQPIEVSVPVQLPAEANPDDLALFHNTGSAVTATLDITTNANGTITGEATSFSEFQAGLLAPPLGAPSGTYQMEILTVFHRLSSDGTTPSSEIATVAGQEFVFRADGSGRSLFGSSAVAFREFTRNSPHHLDVYSESSVGSVDFEWEQIEQGRFSFTFPTQLGDTATAEGIVSESGNVISFTARGGSIEFFAVGVRTAEPPTAAEFEGRWLAVEMGVELLDTTSENFRTRTFSRFSGFDVDAEASTMTFHESGESFLGDRAYLTNSPPTLHTRELSSDGDGGVEQFGVFAGQIGSDQNRRSGFLDADRNVFVARRGDATTRSVSIMLAVRQPATVAPETFEGTYRLSRMELTTRVEEPAAGTSRTEVDPGVGVLTATSGQAVVSMEAVERATYALTSSGPVNGLTWTSTRTLSDATPGDDAFQLVLDAAGNHRPNGAARWYGVSGTGDVILSSTPGNEDDGIRGIAIGLR